MITFAGKQIPDFVKVNKIGFSILPSIEVNTLKVKGRAGVLDYGNDIGERRITADITITATKPNEVLKQSTILAEWLFYRELQPLILADEPDKFYMARVEGETNVDELLTVGTGTISFLCPSPFKESLTPKVVTTSGIVDPKGTVTTVENKGSTEAYPQIELTMKQDSPVLVLTNDQNQFIQVGQDETDIIKAIPNEEMMFEDFADTTNGWTTGKNYDGAVTADIVSDGWKFYVKDNKYGTADWNWHGGGLLKSLSRPVADFTFKFRLSMFTREIDEMGKVEFYLLAADDRQIARCGLVDASTTSKHPYFYMTLGNGLRNVIYFQPKQYGLWSNFDGYVQITRRNNFWEVYITNVDWWNGWEHSGQYFTFDDPDGVFRTEVAKVQFFIATYGGIKPCEQMFIDDMFFKDLKPQPELSIPIVLKKDDKLLIDSKTAIIRKNGKVAYELLNPLSDFFPLQKGVNKISVAPSNVDVKITYTERWL